jgi:hypothetical protein
MSVLSFFRLLWCLLVDAAANFDFRVLAPEMFVYQPDRGKSAAASTSTQGLATNGKKGGRKFL